MRLVDGIEQVQAAVGTRLGYSGGPSLTIRDDHAATIYASSAAASSER